MTAGKHEYDVVIVGGGQAGLSVGQHLAKAKLRFVILEANERIGDQWRRQWETLRLFTPARFDSLPGMRFPTPAYHYPTKDEMADYLESYATTMGLPVHTGVRVASVSPADDGYLVETSDGPMQTSQVVIAVNWQRAPSVPPFAAALDGRIRQLHSSEYRHPGQLQPGPVVVVGASHSGADIALEVAADHETWLVGPDRGQMPFRIDSRRARFIIPALWLFASNVLTLSTPLGRKVAPKVRSHGGPLLRVHREDLAAAGVHRSTARAVAARDGLPALDDGQTLDVANVVWCTGFRPDFGFIRLPVTGDDGWPIHDRGVVATAPGLYFAGLAFQRAFTSMLVGGAGRDAGALTRHIVRRARHAARARRGEAADVGAGAGAGLAPESTKSVD